MKLKLDRDHQCCDAGSVVGCDFLVLKKPAPVAPAAGSGGGCGARAIVRSEGTRSFSRRRNNQQATADRTRPLRRVVRLRLHLQRVFGWRSIGIQSRVAPEFRRDQSRAHAGARSGCQRKSVARHERRNLRSHHQGPACQHGWRRCARAIPDPDRRQRRVDYRLRASRTERRLCHVRSHGIQSGRSRIPVSLVNPALRKRCKRNATG